ncbi:hypothetical protein [Bradyrhizobium sp. AUGA SZCCT0431]|uniref:hypothetical protein n=1 Tax=Bradyrhizobium sp. AUGA SZCCT0431 TaxID=2807674 RepID=UPI001BA758E4|nr:hypothetical protein [Bradyrhizobium sp. AUGA SZCCT0431]MBR1141854.1 hypothetical protein [Bradyrhizobium sp. AUGA SZCCT0431]
MQSFSAEPAHSHYTTRIHPALASFADELCGTLVRLVAYVMTLALLAMGGMALWEQLPDAAAMDPSSRDASSLKDASLKDAWSLVDRSSRAFAVSQFDPHDKTEAYEIFRHPKGGRRDVFQWRGADKKPVAELEIYRPGGELGHAGPAIAEIAARMDPGDLEAAGLIDSKFGAVTLLRLISGAEAARGCLGFMKRVSDSNFRISGWSCQGDSLPARRAAISCMLNRLTLLSTGNDPKLAEIFARAELRRADCATSAAPALSADWLTGGDNPQLRGAF